MIEGIPKDVEKSRRMNAVEIEEAVSELAGQPFDGEEFAYQFLAAFGRNDTAIKRLRSGNTNQSDVPGGVLQRSHIHLATCAAGEVDVTLKALRDSPKTASAKAKFGRPPKRLPTANAALILPNSNRCSPTRSSN